MTIHLDDNLEQDDAGSVTCRHCGASIGIAADLFRDARVRESSPEDAGPSVRAEPRHFTDREVVLRQVFCPGCLVLLQAEIVPADEPSSRIRSVGVLPS